MHIGRSDDGRGPSLAFLGLGIMGLPMAGHLAAAGRHLQVWNRTPGRAQTLARYDGVKVCSTVADAVTSAPVIIVMLSTGPVVDQVLFASDPDGESVEAALHPGSLVIVMSSIPVSTAREQAERLRRRGIRYIDAPVSGGEAGAKAASLTIMAGGETADIEEARPVLQLLGTVTHVGPVGTGQWQKHCFWRVKEARTWAVSVRRCAVASPIPRYCGSMVRAWSAAHFHPVHMPPPNSRI